MKKKWMQLAIIGVLCISALTACGDGSEKNVMGMITGSDENTGTGTGEGEADTENSDFEEQGGESLSPTAAAIADYEERYSTNGLNSEEYRELAQLYMQNGQIKKQRDMLEQCWRMYGDQEAFALLQDITVNAQEEGTALQQQAELLMQNLDIPEYRNEAASVIYSQDWFQIMMPKLKEGKRNYYYETQGADGVMVWSTGYDLTGRTYTNVWYRHGEEMVILRQTPESIQMVTTGFSNGKYQGAFESWLCVAASGDVRHETGTFTDGLVTGAFSASVHSGTEPLDLIALWATRLQMDFTVYTGNFDENGVTTLEQPDSDRRDTKSGGQEGKEQVIYAYTEDESGYLFLNVNEGTAASDQVFTAQLLGAPEYPAFGFYAPVQQSISNDSVKEVQINAADVKIRIYDSNLEWFDGTRWHTAGTVEEYEAQDPFQSYTGRENEVPGIISDENGENITETEGSLYSETGIGAVKKAQTKPSGTTSKPGTKPTNPSTPNPTPSTPTPTPSTPDPTPSTPDPTPSAPDPTPSTPDPTPSTPDPTPSTPDPTPSTPSEGNGDETDIEWSDDIL